MLSGLKWRKLEKVFIAGALISAVVNICLVFYITHTRFHGTGSPLSSGLPDEGPTVILKRNNEENKFKIEIYRENDIVSGSIEENSYGWESEQIRALTTFFTNYSKQHKVPLSELTFVDIGANIGWYTLNIAALGVNVIAFEPMEENLQILKHSLNLPSNIKNGIRDRVTLYEHGLGEKDESCFIFSDNGNVGDGHVQCVPNVIDLKMKENYFVRGMVTIKRLDDAIPDANGMHIVAIKMDTEGYESNVLEGGKKLFLESGVDLIITEFVPDSIVEKGGDPVKFMKTISDAGYAAKTNTFGYEYFKKEEMLDMQLFGDRMLTIHSPPLINATLTEGKQYEMEEQQMANEMGDYEDSAIYYEDKNSNPIMKTSNEEKEFVIELYKEKDIVSNAIMNSWVGWEPDVVRELNEIFKNYSKKHNIPLSNLTFMDIGANIGWLTMNMAALGVKVIAFEPMQENLKLLQSTLKKKTNIENGLSDRITLHEHGLGVKEETCFLYSDNENFGDGHIKCVEKESDLELQANYTIRERVPLKRLDDVVKITEGMHIVAVKMDTEGYEGNILEGGSKVLLEGGIDVIQTEFEPKWLTEKGGDPVKFIKKMIDAGYHIKKKEWGYMKEKDMMNMTNFGLTSGDVTFHSKSLVDEFMGIDK